MTGKGSDLVTLVYWYDLNRLGRGTQPDQPLAPGNPFRNSSVALPRSGFTPQERGACDRLSPETRQLRLILHRVNPNLRATVRPRRNRQKKRSKPFRPLPK